MNPQTIRILEHDWDVYLMRLSNIGDLNLPRIQRDGFEPHLKALYGGDFDKAKKDYYELMGDVEKGLKAAAPQDPLTSILERYIQNQTDAERKGVPALPIEMEPFSPNLGNLRSIVNQAFSNALKPQEREVLEDLFFGRSMYTEVAKKLGISVTEVDYILQRVIGKLGLYYGQIEGPTLRDFIEP